MTGYELIKKLQELGEEALKKQVKFYNPKYENYQAVSEVRNWEDKDPRYNFILLNEE